MASYWTRTLQRRLSRRRALIGSASAGAGAFAIALTGCGGGDGDSDGGESDLVYKPADSSSKAVRGGVMQLYMGTGTETFDQVTGNFAVQAHTDHAYSRLIKYKTGTAEKPPEGEVEAEAATSWESTPDGLTWTFKMRQGMKFDARPPTNGRTMLVDDVRQSWSRFAELSTSRSQLVNSVTPDAPVKAVEFPDASTAVFKMAFPFGAFLRSIGYSWHFAIMPLEASDRDDATHFDVRQHMRGSGPWLLSKYTPSVGFEYQRNPNWYGHSEKPYLDGINYTILAEQAAQDAQFKTGNLWQLPMPNADLVLGMKQENLKVRMRANSPFQGNGSHNILGFSKRADSPWFTDVRMRRAVSMLLDRDAWIDAFWNVANFERSGIPMESGWHSHIPTSWPTLWLNPKGKELGAAASFFQHNPSEATKLLQAAGQHGSEHQYTYHTSGGFGGQTLVRQNEVITQMLQQGGHFKLKIVNPEYVTDFRPNYLWNKGDYPGIVGNHPLGGWPDWDLALWSGYTPGSRNDWVRVPIAKAHDLMVEHRRESDDKKRHDLMVQWQRVLADEMWVVPHPGQASTFSLEQPWMGNAGWFSPWVPTGGLAGGHASETLISIWYDRSQDPKAGPA
jgi:ABC-type transport system substrate-binding protein